MAGPTFSYLRNPHPHISGGPYDFYGRLHSWVGRSHGGFQDFGYLDSFRPQAPNQLSGVQGGHVCPTALGSSASGPPGYDRHGQFDSSFIYQQAGRDSLPHLATLDCRPFPLVTVSEHNSPGKTHSRLSERDSRPPISSESANTDRVQSLGDSCTRTPSILPQGTKLYSSVPAYGSLNWASGLIALGHLYPRPLQRHFHSLGLKDRFTPPRRSDTLVLANLLRRWLDQHFLTSGIPIRTFRADLTIFTDASTHGWGAHMGDSKISGTWTPSDRKLQINCLDFKAVMFALQHWAPLLQGRQVMIATDNSTVVSYINKQGGTRSLTLLRLTVDLFLWLESQKIIVRARHIPGCLNVIADHLSHPNQPIPTEWSLHPEILERIFRVWGTPEVDMFATLSNSHLPRFMSPIPEPRALAVDALSQDWQGRSMYMFPPIPPAQQSHAEASIHSGGGGNSRSPPGGRLGRGFHIYYVSVWYTL